jgi:hypothetical protein
MVPADDRAGSSVYSFGELVAAGNSILSVTVISHAGCDGPFIPMINHRGFQANYELVRWDKQTQDANSLTNRLVRGARLRFCGCNTGTDYLWYEVDRPGYRANPSVGHGIAALLADRQVVVHGKYNSGDVKNHNYVSFSCPPGRNYPVRHGKEKNGYSFGTTRASTKFQDIRVSYANDSEREAYLGWYRQRGYQIQNGQGTLTVKAPQPVWYNRSTPKPKALTAIVQAIDRGLTDALAGNRSGPGLQELAQVRALVPWTDSLLTDGKLVRAIQEAKAANGGTLDMHDFRIWAVMLRPDHKETAYRADLCDDPTVARTRVLQ